MNIYQLLTAQMAGMQLPLFAVSLTAIPRANTPFLLMMHWHGFRQTIIPELPQMKPIFESVPCSALQVNKIWGLPEIIEQDILDAAWQLGAWDLKREEHRGCNTIGASMQEAQACKQAFGVFEQDTELPLIAEAPDQKDMLDLGAKVGFMRWIFRPVSGGLWESTAEDDTLLDDGKRALPCPVKPLALKGGKHSYTNYRFGKVNRIIF